MPQLNRPTVHDLGPVRGQLQHLLVADLFQRPCLWNDPWVCRVDAFDIGIDLAYSGPQAGRQSHRGGVRSTSTQGGHVHVFGDALKAGHNDDIAFLKLSDDPFRFHLKDTRPPMGGVRPYSCLAAAEADRLLAHGPERHRQQGAGNELSGGQKGVKLAAVRVFIDLVCQADQAVRGLPHGGNSHDNLIALVPGCRDTPGDIPHLLSVRHRRTAVFLDY